MAEEQERREFDPVVGSFPDKDGISCKDCKFRDKEVLELGSRIIPVGVARDTCSVFDGDKVGYKPHDILFGLEDCEFYEEDES